VTAPNSAASAVTWKALPGRRESQTTVCRTAGAVLSVELSTMISVICMVNGSNIQSPR